MKSHSLLSSTGVHLTSSSTARGPIVLLTAALLLAALASSLLRPAPSWAQGSSAACVSRAAHPAARDRVCTARKHNSHAKAKAKRHHAKHVVAKNKKSKRKSGVHASATPAPTPAVCEDASSPMRESEGFYACADGSEPICTNGSEPVAASKGSGPVCPTAPSATFEWDEASCEDGSAPSGASYACEDGSQPECEDGTQPVLSDDATTFACTAYGSPGSSSSGEESEGAHKELDMSAS